jgi:hypothetical protein
MTLSPSVTGDPEAGGLVGCVRSFLSDAGAFLPDELPILSVEGHDGAAIARRLREKYAVAPDDGR